MCIRIGEACMIVNGPDGDTCIAFRNVAMNLKEAVSGFIQCDFKKGVVNTQ